MKINMERVGEILYFINRNTTAHTAWRYILGVFSVVGIIHIIFNIGAQRMSGDVGVTLAMVVFCAVGVVVLGRNIEQIRNKPPQYFPQGIVIDLKTREVRRLPDQKVLTKLSACLTKKWRHNGDRSRRYQAWMLDLVCPFGTINLLDVVVQKEGEIDDLIKLLE